MFTELSTAILVKECYLLVIPKYLNNDFIAFAHSKSHPYLREGAKFIVLHKGKWEILSPQKSLGPVIFSPKKVAAPSFSFPEKGYAPSFFSPKKVAAPSFSAPEKVYAPSFLSLKRVAAPSFSFPKKVYAPSYFSSKKVLAPPPHFIILRSKPAEGFFLYVL